MSGQDKITRGQLLLSPFALWSAAAGPRVVFVCGDHEYSGELTLPRLGRELEARYGWRPVIVKSVPDQNGETDIPGLDVLEGADLAVFYLRWRRLPEEQLAHIAKYLRSGRPVMGLRTSSHAFHYPKGDAREEWNRWGPKVFGTPPGWNAEGHTHYGHESTTVVRVVTGKEKDPLVAGVAREFAVPSWLYHVKPKYPPAGARVVLEGEAVKPNKPAVVNPVAWMWQNEYGAKSFYTSLGHPGDLGLEPVQRLLVNAMHELLGRKLKKWTGSLAIDVPYRGMVKTGA